MHLYPNVMPSSTNTAFSLTVTNAASTDYTLTIMTVVAVIFTPLVLVYQGWTYWVFRKRVTSERIPAASSVPAPTATS
jgi:cytochrome d ubiquinol oxidase subunit II